MKCKFHKTCGHFDPKAMTCSETGGGSYCGRFRALSPEHTDDVICMPSARSGRKMLV